MKRSIVFKIFLLLLIPTAFFVPIFFMPALILSRNNDLTEFFWPIFYYVKQSILLTHHIPYWNNIFFAGTPLLPDPQNPIWYLPNIIFLFTNIDTGILISLFLHTVLGTFGMYFLSRKVLKFSKLTSYLLTFLFIFSTQLFSFFDAGHWGLIISWCYMPLLISSAYFLSQKPSWKYILIFAFSASSIYFNHVLTAFIIGVPIAIYWIFKRNYKFPAIALVATFVIISPALYFQSKWIPTTTRSILLENPETFPVWRGKKEFLKSLFLFNPETEKAITIGIVPSLIAGFGFLKLKRKRKLVVFLIVFLLSIITLNNVSPIKSLLLKIDLYILMRVSTRVWFLVFFIVLFLIGYGLEKLNKKIVLILIFISMIELSVVGFSYLKKPISIRENIPDKIYEIIESDKTDFRVLCITLCIPQKEAAIRNIHLVEGYGTLQSKDYYYGIQKALNTSWSNYTLVIPPFDVFLYQKPQPNAKELLKFNTKYVISKYPLTDKNFELIDKQSDYYIFVNSLWN